MYLLAGFAIVIGWIHLRPFLSTSLTGWGWQNWWFGFAPAAYLAIAATVAVVFERYSTRCRRICLPIVLTPLLAVTGLILFATYVDFPNIVAGKYDWKQNLHSLLIAVLCPVVWYYNLVASVRSWRTLRNHGGD